MKFKENTKRGGERERETGASLLSMAAQAFNTFATKHTNAKRQQGRGEQRVGEGKQEVEEEDVEGRATVLVPARVQASPRRLLTLPHSHFECRRVFGIDYVSCCHSCPTLCSSAPSAPPPPSRQVICTCFDVNAQNFIKKTHLITFRIVAPIWLN